ncbi:MAG TPA: MFS transporter, partial [Bacteroidales bacterium]|nr:MFS transporter [Bacteroidales bacterium]
MIIKAKHRSFYILFLVFVIYLIDFADRKVMSVLFESIKYDWNITDVQLSLLEGVTSLVIAVCVLPMAIAIDRWSRKYMIAIMVAAWSIITFVCAFAENYTQLLILRALIGIGEAAYAPAAVSLLSKSFPARHRAKYIGIFDAAAPLGVALGMIVGGYIGMIYGWRHAFGIVAIPGIIAPFEQ